MFYQSQIDDGLGVFFSYQGFDLKSSSFKDVAVCSGY